MKTLVVATTNSGKLREIKGLLADLPIRVLSMADYPDAPPIVEDGRSFRENALKKARVMAAHTGHLSMGEDSGLQVRALGNAPGIFSARFAGPNATDQKNNAKLLRLLRGVPLEERQARYCCCIALVKGDQVIGEARGYCEGLIALRKRGSNGFGYDPYFLIPRYDKTFGQLDPAVKARISHRARALRRLRGLLVDYWTKEDA